ncbi:MAG: hypothetical protein UE295_04510 [Acutalibacteraceae bacterium]|nr:hypothetical protein [Acutalibacteraceae bacterium]
MKKNMYTDAVSKITVPEDVLEKGLESIRNTEPTTEVINLKEAKAKLNWFKPLSVVAAVLAVVIGLNSVGIFNKEESNPFILTAYAQELNTESYVKVGDMPLLDVPMELSRDENYNWLIKSSGVFYFDVKCIGENIETITYSTNTGEFCINKGFEGLIDYKRTADEENYGSDYRFTPFCVFDYEHQPHNLKSGILPLRITFDIPDAQELYNTNSEKYFGKDGPFGADKYEATAKMFIDSKYTYSAQVTATFTDGSTTTQTLEFKCEHGEDGYYLAAKIVETPSEVA